MKKKAVVFAIALGIAGLASVLGADASWAGGSWY